MRLILDDIFADDLAPPPWLIPSIMIDSQMVLLAGDSGVGKSVLMCVWAVSLACGLPILGASTVPIRVLYINEENSWYEMREYLRWARFGLGLLDESLLCENLRMEQLSLTLSPGKWHATLRMIVAEFKPKLIIIDTATPACQIQDEDKNGEASVAIGHLRRAQREAADGCGMLVLKHAKVINKGEDRTIRGAKIWKGACDSMIFHTKTAGRPRDDGLHCSYLWPDKARAFGLRERLKITPKWVLFDNPNKKGILFTLFADPE